MTRQTVRNLVIGVLAVAVLAIAHPADAQTGALRGKVVDKNGRPAPLCEIVLDFVGDVKRQIKTVTDNAGEWVRAGIPVGGGTWTVTATCRNLLGKIEGVTIKLNESQRLQDIVILSEEDRAKIGSKPVSVVSDAAAEAAARRNADVERLLTETNAAIDGGRHDEAVEKLTALAAIVDKCSSCFLKIGEIRVAQKNIDAAEAAFLKVIEIDPNLPGPYTHLAAIYNQQGKLEEAGRMAAKAGELMSASGSADPAAYFNQGVIFWNQSKIAEAKAQWAKAVELDPKMADAHYWLGMASLNQGQLPDAKKAFETYLQLAPAGQHAATAKQILAQIK